MKIKELIDTLQGLNELYGNIDVLKWDLNSMSNIDLVDVIIEKKRAVII